MRLLLAPVFATLFTIINAGPHKMELDAFDEERWLNGTNADSDDPDIEEYRGARRSIGIKPYLILKWIIDKGYSF